MLRREMGFRGELGEVTFGDLLQFVHLGARTGTLVLENERIRAEFGVHEGGIINAWTTDCPRLGELLVAQKIISPEVLEKALEVQQATTPHRSIGDLLLDVGAIDDSILRSAAVRQIESTVHRVVTWTAGTFEFAFGPPRRTDSFDEAFVSGIKLDSQAVLLRIARLVDEARREGGATPLPVEEPRPTPAAARAPAAATTPADVPFEVYSKLKRVMLERRIGSGWSTLALELMSSASDYAERAVVFGVAGDRLESLGAFGHGPKDKQLAVLTAGAQLAPEEMPLLARALTGEPVERGINDASDLGALAEMIGPSASPEAVALAVQGSSGPVAVIYLDNGAKAEAVGELSELEVTLGVIGLIFENQRLQDELASSP